LKSYIPFLSLRYLWFHKVSSALGMLGVTFGVGLVIVVVAVMDGFQARLRLSLLSNTSAVIVRPYYEVDAEKLVAALKERVPGVKDGSPVVHGVTLVLREGRRFSQGFPCRVLGVDAPREKSVADFERKLHLDGRPEFQTTLIASATPDDPFRVPEAQEARDRRVREEKRGIILGSKLMDQLGLKVEPDGKTRVRMFLVRAEDDERPGATPDLKADSELFTVTGMYTAGDMEFGGFVLMDRRDAISFYRGRLRQEVDEVRLLLDDPERAEEVKRTIEVLCWDIARASLKEGATLDPIVRPIDASTWKEEHVELLAAVANERGLLLVITSFSFLVVAFLIGSTQSMLVVEKTREIGVLRSLGASVAGTSAVFLGNGFFIGTTGALAGWGLGAAITGNIQAIADFLNRQFGLNLFPENIYRFNRIPIDVRPDFVLMVCAGAIAFALVGSLLPAIRAATLDPVESLHHE